MKGVKCVSLVIKAIIRNHKEMVEVMDDHINLTYLQIKECYTNMQEHIMKNQ
jgi:hypothetical protein